MTKGLRIPRESDLEGQQDLIIGLPLDSGNSLGDSSLGGHKQKLAHNKKEEKSSDPTED